MNVVRFPNIAAHGLTEMAANELWGKLLQPRVLKHGWHLSRNDVRADFVEDHLSIDVLAGDLDENIREIAKRLATDTYEIRPLLRIDVPKGTLAVRPGSVPTLLDRVVLFSIILLLAPSIDEKFPDGVYSYRLKKEGSTRKSLFKDTDLIEIPFLKRKTIIKLIEPFEPWYGNWPEFERVTRKVFSEEGYRFLAVSDIAAYFENIQLGILRDQLLSYFPHDSKVINFLSDFFEIQAVKTDAGRAPLRGIPQGSAISSFVGNLFLLPLDLHFTEFSLSHDAKYYRYMDDVRIFTKDIETARRAKFDMDVVLRSLHLNVQSAKTKIFEGREISHILIDDRIDDLSDICNRILQDKKDENLTAENKKRYLKRLKQIADQEPGAPNEKKISGARAPLSGLSLRAFRRWITAHSLLKSQEFVDRLMREIVNNPDYRLTRRVVTTARQFPRRTRLGKEIFEFIQSDLNIFPH